MGQRSLKACAMLPVDLILSAFVLILVLSITPGPNNMMLASSGATFGFRRTIPHIIGIVLGFPLLLVLVGLGAAEVFNWVPWLYPVMKWTGFAWLCWLAWRIAQSGPPDGEGNQRGRPMYLIEAAAFQWINPKAWMMALSINALFVEPGPSSHWQVVSLGMIALCCSPISSTSWAAIGVVISKLLTKAPRLLRAVNIGLAVLMLASVVPGLLDDAGFVQPAVEASTE